MKILQIIHRYPPSVGGSQLHAYEVSRHLVKLGHEVTVATTMSVNPVKDVRGFSSAGFFWRNSYPNFPEYEKQDGIEIYRFKPDWQFLTYLSTPSLKHWLSQHAKEYDVVHAHGYTFAEAGYVANCQAKRKVLTAHDLTQPHAGFVFHLIMSTYNNLFGKKILSLYDSLVALTEENRKDYLKLNVNSNKISIIPNGVDEQKFLNSKSKKTDGPEILFVGRLVEYKGAQYIIEALPKILKKYPNAHLTIVGEDQGYAATLKQLAEKYDVTNAITFAGSVSNKQLLEYYNQAHYFVLPSINEGFGLVVLEAIMAGCYPIIAEEKALKYLLRDIGGSGIRISHAADDISNAIFSLEQNNREEAVGCLTDIVKKRYTWTAIAKQLESMYQNQ